MVIQKESAGKRPEQKISSEFFDAMRNPIARAGALNESQMEYNIVMGFCVGHDSMFYKYCDGLVTTLVVKDRVLAHNPAGAIYCV